MQYCPSLKHVEQQRKCLVVASTPRNHGFLKQILSADDVVSKASKVPPVKVVINAWL